MEPRTITQAEAADLLASGYETGRYEPLGLFLVGEAGGTWTGIDNSTGNAWTEEFGTQAECLKWLKGENAVFTLDEAVSRIYELSAEAHMNMARNLKERRTWCEKNLKNYQTIKRAFEKVLDIRYAERLEVYRYYYGEGAAMRHSPHTCGLLPIFHRGRDSWSRPVYDDGTGRLLVDVDPRAGRKPDICTKQGNAFDGEPCDPVDGDFIFIPRRDTW